MDQRLYGAGDSALVQGHQVFGGAFALVVWDKFVLDFLTLAQDRQSRPFNGRDMHEGVVAPVFGLDETVPLGASREGARLVLVSQIPGVTTPNV